MKKPNLDKPRARRSQVKILAAAEELFLKNGFRGTSLDDIAALADVSKQTVYSHFQSKRQLFTAVIGHMVGGAEAKHRIIIEQEILRDSPDDYLTHFATEQLTIVLTSRLLRLRRLVIGEAERFPELGEALYLNGPAASISRLAEYFKSCVERHELHITDAHQAASFFNWIVMGAPTNAAMMLGDSAILMPRDIEKHVAESVRIFLTAYAYAKTTNGKFKLSPPL